MSNFTRNETKSIAVVIPAYKVSRHICDVVDAIGPEVSRIYVVDDACPEESGCIVQRKYSHDSRVKVIFNEVNQGVGGAVMAGYRQASLDGAAVIVKVDGDGQMDPSLIPAFVEPILRGHADYTKGNRFYSLDGLSAMPRARVFGNAVLSFMTKFSTGYWNIFDPTNGFTAIHASLIAALPLDKISRRYFFETDMLFRLGTLRAVVRDIPMVAVYGDEVSGLKIRRIVGEFAIKHAVITIKRIFYSYYLRDASIGSVELPLGLSLFGFGVIFGAVRWIESILSGVAATAGTAVIAAVSLMLGVQLILGFLANDMANTPAVPIGDMLERKINCRMT